MQYNCMQLKSTNFYGQQAFNLQQYERWSMKTSMEYGKKTRDDSYLKGLCTDNASVIT